MGLWELDSSGGALASGTWASKPLGYLGHFLSGFLCSPPELVFGKPKRGHKRDGPNWGSLHGDIDQDSLRAQASLPELDSFSRGEVWCSLVRERLPV